MRWRSPKWTSNWKGRVSVGYGARKGLLKYVAHEPGCVALLVLEALFSFHRSLNSVLLLLEKGGKEADPVEEQCPIIGCLHDLLRSLGLLEADEPEAFAFSSALCNKNTHITNLPKAREEGRELLL